MSYPQTYPAPAQAPQAQQPPHSPSSQGMGRSYEAVGAILVTIVISTALFAGYYQYGSTKRINATNKLNYYNASQLYLPYSDPAMNIDVNEINPLADGESGGYQVWDQSKGNSGERL